MKNKLRIVYAILILAAGSVFVYWYFKAVDAQKNRDQVIAQGRLQTIDPLPPPSITAYHLGEPIDLGDRRITVFGFQNYKADYMKTVYATSQGQAMDVLIENTGATAFGVSPLHFTVQDQDGRALPYYDVHPGGKRPTLEMGAAAPTQKIRAYITYASDKKPVEIFYHSPDGSMAKVAIP